MKKLSDLCSTLLTIEIVMIVLLALCTTVPRLVGYNEYTVISGSMAPTIPIGSLVLVKSEDASQIEAGDVIAFQSHSSAVVTHRVVSKDDTAQEFTTKGDANESEDFEPIPYTNLLGKVVFSVPYLGNFLATIFSTTGKIIMGVIALVLLLAYKLFDKEK